MLDTKVKHIGRWPYLLVAVSALAGCRKPPSDAIELKPDVTQRLGPWEVRYPGVKQAKDGRNFATIHFTKKVEILSKEDDPTPFTESIQEGGCIELDKIYYCAERLEPGKTVIMVPKYEQKHPWLLVPKTPVKH